MATNYFVILLLLLMFCSQLRSYSVKTKTLYKLDPEWPVDYEAFEGPVYSAAVDDRNKEVYVSQRGDGIPHVLVFDLDVGTLKRNFTYTDKDILQDLHGMRYQFNETNNQGYVWVTDVGNGTHGYTVKRLLPNGELDLELGTPGKAGTSLHPLQFGNVADLAINEKGVLYIADGDGGLNNRVVKVELRSSGALAMWSIGGNGTTPGQFRIPHSVELDDMGRVWVADRMNGRLEAFDAASGEFIDAWTSCFKDGEPYSVRLSKDKTHFIVAQLLTNRISFIQAPAKPGPIGDCVVLDEILLENDIKPHLVAVSQSTGALFVGELGSQACQKFIPIM